MVFKFEIFEKIFK